MALVVALGLPLSAHFVGIWIRQWPQPAWKTAIKLFVAVALVVGGLYGINIARRQYVIALDVAESDVIAEAFFLINIMVYVAAVLLSYFSHDPDQELDNLKNRSARLARESSRLDHRLGHVLSRIDDQMARWAATFNRNWSRTKELIHAYRDANLGRRKEAARPLSFDVDPEDPTFVRDEKQRAPTFDEVATVRERRDQALKGIGTVAGGFEEGGAEVYAGEGLGTASGKGVAGVPVGGAETGAGLGAAGGGLSKAGSAALGDSGPSGKGAGGESLGPVPGNE